MDTGRKEILEFREQLIHVRNELDFASAAGLHKALTCAAKLLQGNGVDVTFGNAAVIVRHQRFGDDERIEFVGFSFADSVLAQGGGLNGIDETNPIALAEQVTDKIIAVVRGGFEADHGQGQSVRCHVGGKELKAFGIVRKGKRIAKHLTVGREDSGNVGLFGNVNANVKHKEYLHKCSTL